MADNVIRPGDSNRFLGISGGGWNSHSIASGVISGALAGLSKQTNQVVDLETLMGDVDGLSANSGGSWFLSQLAYSSPFRQALESEMGRNTWNSTGYNGQVAELFKGAVRKPIATLEAIKGARSKGVIKQATSLLQDVIYLAGIAKGVSETGINWRNVVDRYAFGPLGMLAELNGKNLTSPREAWANGKDLVIAAAAQSSGAVMDQIGLLNNKIFAGITSPNVPAIETSQVTPLILISDSANDGSSITAKAVLSAGNSQQLNYSNNKLFANNRQSSTSLASLLQSTAGVIDATIASSAAAALYTSPKTYERISWLPQLLANQLANELRDMSPLGKFEDGIFSMPKNLPNLPNKDSMTTEQVMLAYQNQGLARLADGGYVDNTSAAYMVKQIQDSIGTTDDFNLTILMNSSVDPLTGIRMKTGPSEYSSYWVPRDVGRLFGNSDGKNNDSGVTYFDAYPNPPVVAPYIFKREAWYGEEPVWKTNSQSIDMSYFDIDIETIENAAFGIKGGQKGRLHLFITNNKDSLAAPVTPSILAEYNNNYDFVRDWIGNGVGLDSIKTAFGFVA
jgi:hypothetical protein